MTRIAVFGTGIMGAPIARNLAAAGHEIIVWNRSFDKAEALAGPGITPVQYAHEAARGVVKVKDLRYYRCQPWGISGNIMMGYWCRLDGDDDAIHLDNFELADGAWVSREELRENYTGNGIALTSEMIAEFAAGRDPYSLEAKN